MKQLLTLCLLTLLGPLFVADLFPQENKVYRSTVTVPIPERDIAFAKNNAFQTVKRQILTQAIQDLLGKQYFAGYYRHSSRKKGINPRDYLTSYKVLKEFSKNQKYTMELEGTIQTGRLSETLKKMDQILKNDPWFSVSLLVEGQVRFPFAKLGSRLELFHIKIASREKVDISEVPRQERDQKEFIETLFDHFPQNNIIYLLETPTDEESGNIAELRLRIFRKSDLTQLNTIFLKLSEPKLFNDQDFNKKIDNLFSKLISLLSVNSLKYTVYDEGLQAIFFLNIKGLTVPFSRYAFERNILKSYRTIKNFKLTRLTKDWVEYEIQSNSSLESFINVFQAENPYFDFQVENYYFDGLEISAFIKIKPNVVGLQEWKWDEKTLDKIKEAIYPENVLQKEETIEPELSLEYIPQLAEREPNNNSRKFNRLPESSQMIGRISSRADEDIFQISNSLKRLEEENRNDTNLHRKKRGAEDSAELFPNHDFDTQNQEEYLETYTIRVEWIRLGRTALSPHIRLYDHNFNFLNAYSMIGRQNKLHFSYTIKQAPSKVLYLRISDRIGFIRGETGGYKNFGYLLKYSWEKKQ